MSHPRRGDALDNINTRHPDRLLVIARAFSDHADVTSARAEGIDAQGIDLALETPRGPARARVEFAEAVADYPGGVRVAFVRLARQADDLLR